SVWGAALAGFGAAAPLTLAVGCLALAGAADAGTVVLRGMIVQTAIPDRLRGRITAADYVVGAGGGQLGSVESGAPGSLTTPPISAAGGGIATIVAAIVIGVALPAFTRYRRQPAPAVAGDAPAQATA